MWLLAAALYCSTACIYSLFVILLLLELIGVVRLGLWEGAFLLPQHTHLLPIIPTTIFNYLLRGLTTQLVLELFVVPEITNYSLLLPCCVCCLLPFLW